MSYLTKRQVLLRPVLDKKQAMETDIAELKAKREREDELLTSVSNLLEEKRGEIAEISKALDSVDETLGVLSDEHAEHIKSLRDSLIAAESIVAGFVTVLQALDGKVVQAQERLTVLETDAREVHERIVAEGKSLGRRKQDLDIYRSRLDKVAKEHGLEIKILL